MYIKEFRIDIFKNFSYTKQSVKQEEIDYQKSLVHYFHIDKTSFITQQAVDYILWDYYVEHTASNIVIESRYTLQVTGHV